MKNITATLKKILKYSLIIALLVLVVQCVRAPYTMFSDFFNPFYTGEGLVPEDAANSKGRVEFLLGKDGRGIKMSLPKQYLFTKVEDEMELVSVKLDYETLEPRPSYKRHDLKRVWVTFHAGAFNESRDRSDFKTLLSNDMLIPKGEGIWKIKLPKGRLEINQWKEKYKLNKPFFPAHGGYYYVLYNNSKISLFTCASLCSARANLNNSSSAELTIHKEEMANLPRITQQIQKFINTYKMETGHAH